MEESTRGEKSLTMTVLPSADMVNFSGKIHGGAMLRLLDQVVFRQAIHLGEIVTFLSNVNYTGRSSMEIGIKVVTENPRTRVSRHVMSCYFTMVAVDDSGKSIPVPPLQPETEDEQRLFDGALRRKKLRTDYEDAREGTRLIAKT